jgi:hypothetical protein
MKFSSLFSCCQYILNIYYILNLYSYINIPAALPVFNKSSTRGTSAGKRVVNCVLAPPVVSFPACNLQNCTAEQITL